MISRAFFLCASQSQRKYKCTIKSDFLNLIHQTDAATRAQTVGEEEEDEEGEEGDSDQGEEEGQAGDSGEK